MHREEDDRWVGSFCPDKVLKRFKSRQLDVNVGVDEMVMRNAVGYQPMIARLQSQILNVSQWLVGSMVHESMAQAIANVKYDTREYRILPIKCVA
jgi:hypothetical protein